jgi:hypothetical protein
MCDYDYLLTPLKDTLDNLRIRTLSSAHWKDIHVSVSDLYIPTNGLPILLQENRWTNRGNI